MQRYDPPTPACSTMPAFIFPPWQPTEMRAKILAIGSWWGPESTCRTSATSIPHEWQSHRRGLLSFPVNARTLQPFSASQRGKRRRRPHTCACQGSSVDDDHAVDFQEPRDRSRTGADLTVDQLDLVLQLKAMGRRRQWRQALALFRRAKQNGTIADNNVYR